MSKVIDLIKNKIEDVAVSNNFEIVDIEYVKKYGEMNLTFYIYKDSGVGLDECEFFHKLISPILDELDPTCGEPYVLNVSSPGLDRPLKTDSDFKRNLGKDVEVALYVPIEKNKKHTGTLISFDNTEIVIKTQNKEIKLKKQDIAVIKPAVYF